MHYNVGFAQEHLVLVLIWHKNDIIIYIMRVNSG